MAGWEKTPYSLCQWSPQLKNRASHFSLSSPHPGNYLVLPIPLSISQIFQLSRSSRESGSHTSLPILVISPKSLLHTAATQLSSTPTLWGHQLSPEHAFGSPGFMNRYMSIPTLLCSSLHQMVIVPLCSFLFKLYSLMSLILEYLHPVTPPSTAIFRQPPLTPTPAGSGAPSLGSSECIYLTAALTK